MVETSARCIARGVLAWSSQARTLIEQLVLYSAGREADVRRCFVVVATYGRSTWSTWSSLLRFLNEIIIVYNQYFNESFGDGMGVRYMCVFVFQLLVVLLIGRSEDPRKCCLGIPPHALEGFESKAC